MTSNNQAREHLVSARVALFEADLALAMGNPNAARIQMDLAQAYLTEVSKDLKQPAPRPQICAENHRPD